MAGTIGGKPGEEIALTDPGHHAWAFTCLTDGRIFVGGNVPGQGRGYYLMTPNPGGNPKYERVACDLAKTGVLARVSLSPSEKKVCFEYQKGFKKKVAGRTLFLADFDAAKLAITNAEPFANEKGKPVWFAYPRFTKDGKAIVYHAGKKLFLHTPGDRATRQVSTDDEADYRYPHGEGAPK